MLVERLLRIALLGSSWVMYLLLVLSVFSFAYMIERVIFFRKNAADPDAIARILTEAFERGDTDFAHKTLAKNTSIEAQVFAGALKWVSAGPDAFSDGVESQFGRKKKELERGMGFLGTIGSNAPFIGLFGTVIGVIEAFHQLGEGANKAAMGNVMSGIAEALVATGIGLFVAIPAVIAYNVIQRKIGTIEINIATVTKEVCAWLKARRGETHGLRASGIAPNSIGADNSPSTILAEAE